MARALHCPRDGAETQVESVRGHRGRFRLDVCPTCRGSWFDRGEVAKASGSREVEHLLVRYAGGRTGLSCPKCGEEMAKRPVADVAFAVCARCHGVWADAGVLEDATRSLGGEFSAVTSSGEITSQLFPGVRQGQIARVMFMGFASPSLRYILNPKITRRYPREDL